MLLHKTVAVNQRWLVGELARDVGMLAGEAAPGLKFLHVEIAGVGGLEHNLGASVVNLAKHFPFLRESRCGKCYRDRKCEQRF